MGATLKQLAEQAGVAISTVSGALSPISKNRVSKKKIQEIKNIAKEIGYLPNLSARRLRTGRTLHIGVFVPGLLCTHPHTTYFDLVSSACLDKGYHAIPMAMKRDYDNIPQSIAILEDHHVDGLILLDYVPSAYDHYLQLWRANNAMIFRFLDPVFSDIPFQGVLIDHYSAGKKLLDHVLSEGWTDLRYVVQASNFKRVVKGRERAWAEFSEQASNRGCCCSVINYEERRADTRCKAIREFIRSNGVQKGRTAFILDGGDGSSSVYGILTNAGLEVGRDVALAAMNSIPTNEFVDFKLTFLSEPYEKIANLMVAELLQKTEENLAHPVSAFSYELELVIGASTARVRR